MNFKKETLRARHKIVRVIAPKIYENYMRRENKYEITTRPMINFVLKNFGYRPLIGIEIGVAEGYNALNILQTLNMERLYLIDPYIKYKQYEKTFDYSDKESEMIDRLSKYKNIIELIKQDSAIALRYINKEVDFIYIDGNHEFTYVFNDVMNYINIVKKGGVIGGHDFDTNYLGVVKAVCLYSYFNGYKVYGEKNDWWFVK